MNDLDLAHLLATAATAALTPCFRADPAVEVKTDGSPVSEADLAADAVMTALLAAHRADDAVLSEESGAHGGSERRWLLDPLDGTRAFLQGRRAWGTHVALEVEGELELAVLTRPTERARWWAIRGGGAFAGTDITGTDEAYGDTDDGAIGVDLARGRRLEVSRTGDLSGARVGGFAAASSPVAQAVGRSANWVHDEVSPVVALVEGRLDAVVATAGHPWDHAPQVLLVTEAGGRFTDPTGGRRLDAGGGLYSNGLLHEQLQALRW